VLTFPDGLPWPMIFINSVVGILLVLLFSRSYKVGWGRVGIQ
jgi:hypothetical protein